MSRKATRRAPEAWGAKSSSLLCRCRGAQPAEERLAGTSAVPPVLEMVYSNVSKKRTALLELDEVERCFRRLRPAAMQLGQENDIDSFASRVSMIRDRFHSGEAPASELNELLEALKEDVQAFLKTLQRPH